MIEKIRAKILEAVPDAEVRVVDPHQDGQHFEALVVSASFEGLPLVRQHQKVMNALKAEFAGAVHALQLRTLTPRQWDEEKTEAGKEIF